MDEIMKQLEIIKNAYMQAFNVWPAFFTFAGTDILNAIISAANPFRNGGGIIPLMFTSAVQGGTTVVNQLVWEGVRKAHGGNF